MSFSVLALLGWNGWGWSKGQTVLPTYTLPFVVIIVGVENMSTLTKAVFSIPFSHSVPVRIGLGLRKVGTTIALTSLTDLALLGITWLVFQMQPVREFCVFAAVVIVTDWFMLHTFFLTVCVDPEIVPLTAGSLHRRSASRARRRFVLERRPVCGGGEEAQRGDCAPQGQPPRSLPVAQLPQGT